MSMNGKIRVPLFDLGGVLLKLRDPIETCGLQIDAAEFKEQWLRSASVRQFESGVIDTEEEQYARRNGNSAAPTS